MSRAPFENIGALFAALVQFVQSSGVQDGRRGGEFVAVDESRYSFKFDVYWLSGPGGGVW
jgi:hypothetical protein